MVKKRNDPEVPPIEKWTVKEWEVAYHNLNLKYESVKDQLKLIMIYLHRAIAKIQETTV